MKNNYSDKNQKKSRVTQKNFKDCNSSLDCIVENKKSNFSSLWKENNNPIPNIRLGEFNGIVYALSSFNKLNIN